MINSFSEIINYDGVNFQDHLKRLNLYHLFEPIFSCADFDDNTLHLKIIQYIVFSHSLESAKLTVSGDRRKEIHKIFQDLDIPDEHYENVVMIKNTSVLKAIQLWLKFKDNRQVEYLYTLQNAYVQQQAAALKEIRKSTGEIDYDQKMRCIEHMTELKQMIKDAESELQQNDEKLKEAYKEISRVNKKKTASVEDFIS